MAKLSRKVLPVAIAAGVGALIVGAALRVTLLDPSSLLGKSAAPAGAQLGDSAFVPLLRLDRSERMAQLQQATEQGAALDRARARYLLAVEWIQQGQGGKALPLLEGLEQRYTVMAPAIAVQRARAIAQAGDSDKTVAAWEEVLTRHSDSPFSSEAYYHLGKANPAYWEQGMIRFPAHPRSVEIARQRLRTNPRQVELLLLLARHGVYLKDIGSVLDQLVQLSATTPLSPQDWEAIAFAYWEKQDYGKAGLAYAKARRTPRNLYRAGRGLQLGGKKPEARAFYQQLVQAFPQARETGLALLRLARISDPQTAIAYLDPIIQRFPDRAGEALLEKISLLDAAGNKAAAAQARQILLSQHSNSDGAAELRWREAKQHGQTGNYRQAIAWAKQIKRENPDSELAPEAVFWAGKWAGRLGQQKEAKTAYEEVLRLYPESFYAWRSADLLGLNVGSFTTVRSLTPSITRPDHRPPIKAGSPLLRELYHLGQDRDAWALWQVEFTQAMQPTVAQQYTDGLMRLGVGDNLDGLFMLSFLAERELPEEQSQYQELKHQLDYWLALYPFPFLEPIEQWSEKRQLNPLLVTALIRQESRFMPAIESVAGALGLMQVMPDTGAWIAEKIKLKEYKLTNPNDNIKLGTWYLDYTHAEYDNHSLLAVASYNAGPGAVGDWVTKFRLQDPDEFIEKIPYDETRGYVKSVFANYWNYLRLYNPDTAQLMARYSQPKPSAPPNSVTLQHISDTANRVN